MTKPVPKRISVTKEVTYGEYRRFAGLTHEEATEVFYADMKSWGRKVKLGDFKYWEQDGKYFISYTRDKV